MTAGRRDRRPPRRPAAPPAPRAATSAPHVEATPADPAPPARFALTRGTVVFLVAAWAAMFAPQLFAGRVFTAGDAALFRPFAEFSRQRWVEHRERTHWSPFVFAGMPASVSLADPRPQYLPDAALDAVEAVARAPVVPPLALPLLAHLVGMLATASLARALWGAGPLAAGWAGLAFGLSPTSLVPFAFGHDARFVVTGLAPVALWCIERVAAAPSGAWRPGAALALAAVVGLTGLAGHPQVAYLTALLAAAFGAVRVGRRAARLAVLGGAVALGAAVASAVWWPAFLYTDLSVRGGPGADPLEAAAFSLAWRDLAATVWPWAVGFGDGTYWGGLDRTTHPQHLGLVACAAALFGLGRGPGSRRVAWVLAGAVAFGAVAALGVRLGLLHGVMRAVLPFWSAFRVPVTAVAIVPLALALLSARGVERLLAAGATAWTGRRRALALSALGAVLALALALAGPLAGAYAGAARAARPSLGDASHGVAARAGLDLGWRALVAAAALVALARGGRARVPVALGALALDLGSVAVPFLARSSGPVAALAAPPPPAIARLAAADPLHRASAVTREGLFTNAWVSWRARSISGYHGAALRTWDELRGTGAILRPAVLRGLAVRYVAGALPGLDDTTRFERLTVAGAVGAAAAGVGGDARGAADTVYALRGALPRAYAVPRVEARPAAEVMAAMLDDGFDAARVAYTTATDAAGAYPGANACRIRWVEDAPDRLALDVDAPAPAFVVVADAWCRGWVARIDAHPATLHRVNHLVRGIAVPAGRHRVTLAYTPEGWRRAAAVTRVALAAWLALASIALAQRAFLRAGASRLTVPTTRS